MSNSPVAATFAILANWDDAYPSLDAAEREDIIADAAVGAGMYEDNLTSFGILSDAELAQIDADIDAGMYDADDEWVGEYMSLDMLYTDRLAEQVSDEYNERLFSVDRY